MVDSFATGYYKRAHFSKAASKQVSVVVDEEKVVVGGVAVDGDEHAGHVHVHTHATHGHSHGSSSSDHHQDPLGGSDLIRHRVISQVSSLVSLSSAIYSRFRWHILCQHS